MRTTITALIVAQNGNWLEATLEALAEQSVQANRVIGIINGKHEGLAEKFAAAGVTQIIALNQKTSFGKAITLAEQQIPLASALNTAEQNNTNASNAEPEYLINSSLLAHNSADFNHAQITNPAEHSSQAESTDTAQIDEWLWLLTEDSAPEPKALKSLLSSVLRAPSVAIAGPKLIDWDNPERIIELGQGLTRYGNRWLLRRGELDQQQYDHLQDSLGVGPTGMLVRRSTWRELGGFDPALPVYDDGLDLCVRARLAGHRVIVAPRARVRAALTGIAGPRNAYTRGTIRKNHYQARLSQLHRRISYAPALAAFCAWFALPIFGILRMMWALLREQPGNMLAELFAALTAFFNPGAILRSRRAIKRNNVTGWGAIRPLRTDPKSVRTARLIDKEALLVAQGRARKELHFIATGGLSTLLVSVLLSVALTWWLYGQNELTGGGSAQLSDFSQLWANTRIAEGIPADPFTWVLAILGSLTFFNPSLAMIVFLAASVPLATLGGWLWGAQFTDRTAGRTLTAFAWALSPVVLGSIDHARIQTVVLAVVLPWLLIAATRAHQSWAWAGTTSLLAAAALAAAPVLIPFALLLLIIGVAAHPRHISRILTVALAPAALFFPLVLHALAAGNLLNILRDPGIVESYTPASLRNLLLGFPEFGLEGWAHWFANLGLNIAPTTLLVGFLFLPLAALTLLGVFIGKAPVTLYSSLLGGGGMITAIFSANSSLVAAGGQSVPLWTGSGLALYWIAIITLAANSISALRKAASGLVALTLIGCSLAVSPLLVHLATGQSEARQPARQMPSLIIAAGKEQPNLQTLKLTALSENTVLTEVITGSGLTLDEVRTAAFSATHTAADTRISAVVAAILSPGSTQVSEALATAGISYIILDSEGDRAARAQLQAVLEQQGALEETGLTRAGHVWRAAAVDQAAIAAAQEKIAAQRAATVTDPFVRLSQLTLTANTVWALQAIILGAVLLLALPTGSVTDLPPKRKTRKKPAKTRVTDTTAAEILHEQTEQQRTHNAAHHAAGVTVAAATALAPKDTQLLEAASELISPAPEVQAAAANKPDSDDFKPPQETLDSLGLDNLGDSEAALGTDINTDIDIDIDIDTDTNANTATNAALRTDAETASGTASDAELQGQEGENAHN